MAYIKKPPRTKAQKLLSLEKRRKTNTEKYGVAHPLQSKAIQEKTRQTCQKKYGCDSVSQVEEIRAKSRRTCMSKYGAEYPPQNAEVMDKIIKTKAKIRANKNKGK